MPHADRFNVPAVFMRRIANELVHGGPNARADRTYETVVVAKSGNRKGRAKREDDDEDDGCCVDDSNGDDDDNNNSNNT